MAIDHDSELLPKDRTSMGDDGPEPEEEEEGVEEDEEEEQGQGQGQVVSADGERWPRWLRPLLSSRFYRTCKAHPHSRRGGERNMFCLDCAAARALCSLCVDHDHRGHRVIRIRRSTYSSVVNATDIRGLVDIDGVQTYVINGARIVFLNERGRQHKNAGNARGGFVKHCVGCSRGLQDAFRFCSLSCKFPGCCHDRNNDCPSRSPSPMRNADDQTSTPPPPAPTMPLKRRKGIPHRAPFGNLVV